MRYIDLAQWINDNAYVEGFDEETLVKYLYILIYMLSAKERFFNSAELYDHFAMYGATRIYERLTNKKQFQLNEFGEPKMKKIENILAYIKNILRYQKVDFQNEEFYRGNITTSDIEVRGNYQDGFIPNITTLHSTIEESLRDVTQVDTISALTSLPRLIKKYLVTPFKDQDNIYISCLITFIKYLTVMQENEERFNSTLTRSYTPSYYKDVDFLDVVTLYHLPITMKNYVVLQCRIIKNIILKEFKNAFSTQLPPEEVMKTIMYSGLVQLQGDESNEYTG